MSKRGTGEDQIIEYIGRTFRPEHPRIIKAIGDDTAVTAITERRCLLLTIDTLTEGVHFDRRYFPPYYIGRKAVTVSVSDIAAMGGMPLYLLTAIALPAGTEEAFIEELYRGIKDSIEDYDIYLVGGNTVKADRLSITTTLAGEAEKDEILYRSGAKPGNTIYISGTTGGSGLGLKLLKERGLAALRDDSTADCVKSHLNPTARVELARRIAKMGLATAMIDVSDGLIRDLRHILDSSGTGATIDCARLPLPEGLRAYPMEDKARLELALTGGEDYELLFTAPPEAEEQIGGIADELSIDITPIGIITDETTLKRTVDGEAIEPKRLDGYQHFI